MGPPHGDSLALASCLLVAVACTSTADPSSPPPAASGEVTLEEIAIGLEMPVHLTAPSSDSRLFFVEKAGRILVIEQGNVLPTPFLDITDLVSSQGERGLLSLAFHPDYPTNGYFYVYYTDLSGDSRVDRYTVSADRNRAVRGSAREILRVDQPNSNHNGGLIAFGPDEMLYTGLGDGGGSGDPDDNGQDLNTLLGALLRIDVRVPVAYAIPPNNPYVGDANARDEIWAYGLRNPWRFSFDEVGADPTLYIADVGQNSWEEVNAVSAEDAGLNYGWRLMEGSSCFNPSNCDTTRLIQPVLEYATGDDGCAVVGGYVYLGIDIPGLAGTYFYSDNCSGWIRSFRLVDGAVTESVEWDLPYLGPILSFGQDGAGELYILSAWGTVHKFVAADD